MSVTSFDPRRDFFTPSVKWCRDAASRFSLRESSPDAGGEEEIAAIQHDVTLRLWRFLATVARRAATRGTPSLRLASAEGFESDVAAAIGERMGFETLQDRDLLDRLAAEFHTWLVEDNQGRRETPWGALLATEDEMGMDVVPLESSDRIPPHSIGTDTPTGDWETRKLRSVGRVVPTLVVTPLQRVLRQVLNAVTHGGVRFRD
jgi:hypothetical protein